MDNSPVDFESRGLYRHGIAAQSTTRRASVVMDFTLLSFVCK
jgi:hypothetical protein